MTPVNPFLRQAFEEREKLIGDNLSLKARLLKIEEELDKAKDRLARVAITDGLTGLYNYRYFQERLSLEVERSKRADIPVSLLMVDIDYFKRFNDTFGHQAGDRALIKVSELLASNRRATDIVARYGGEEFAILLTDTACESAFNVANQIRKDVEYWGLLEGNLTISVGVASCPETTSDPILLVRLADEALYKAKENRNSVVISKGCEV